MLPPKTSQELPPVAEVLNGIGQAVTSLGGAGRHRDTQMRGDRQRHPWEGLGDTRMLQNIQMKGDRQQHPWEGLGDTGMLPRVMESSRAGGREVLSPKYQTRCL